MSFDFNYNFWLATKKDIKQIIKTQDLLKQKEPIDDPKESFDILCQMYIMYSELVDKLGYLYNKTFQVQKKEVIYSLIEPAINRLIELKNMLKEIELSEFVYLDKTLVERKLTPYDLLIWNSSFRCNRPLENEAVSLDQQLNSKTSIEHAVTNIQSHERARRARMLMYALDENKNCLGKNLVKKVTYSFVSQNDGVVLIPIKRTVYRSNFMKSSTVCQKALYVENLDEIQTDHGDPDVAELLTKSASTIQKAWKIYRAKKILKMKVNTKQLLYGMRNKKKLLKPGEHERSNITLHQQLLKQNQLDKDYVHLMNVERTRLLEEHKPQIMEDISDHVRYWFREFYDKTGDFHPYPDAKDSGTVLLLVDETMNIEEFKEHQQNKNLSKEQQKALENLQKLQEQQAKEKAEKEKLKEKMKARKMRSSGVYDIKGELESNKYVGKIEQVMSQFSVDWKNVDEYLNKQNDVIKEWVTQSELAAIHKELRVLVDKYMRIEYDLLRKALCADKKEKFKPTREKKTLNKQKKLKKSTFVDDNTIKTLYQELLMADIICNYEVKAFEDYIGDFNVLADDSRNANNLTTLDATKGDIKFVIQDMLFGLGAFKVEKSKSLCLLGPESNGKKLLCKIIASELGALFINLSPEKTIGFANNMNKFISDVMNVAKAFQPTIIFIEDAHRIYWKKVPKDQLDLQPTLLKNVLTKRILKSIGKSDKVMVVGTSNLPWSAKKTFTKAFQNILMIPESDYGTIFLMWLELLTQNVNRIYFEDSILSVLAKIFRKYNTGDINDSVKNSLNVERRLRLHSHPLSPNEFLDYFLSQSNPVFAPDEKVAEKFKSWYNTSVKYGKLRSSKNAEKTKKK